MDHNLELADSTTVDTLNEMTEPRLFPDLPRDLQNSPVSLRQGNFEVRPDLSSETDGSVKASPVTRRHALRRLLLVGAGVVALGGSVYFGRDYWLIGRFHVSTDDAYIQADTVTIAPKVPGYLTQVLVGDNETVKAGQVLARVDPRDYMAALGQARADVAAAAATIASKQAAIEVQQSNTASARATITVDRFNQIFAEQDSKRYAELARTGFGSVQNAQQTASRTAAALAAIQRDEAALVSAVAQVGLQNAELAQAQAALAHSQAVQDQAELNLGYAAIASPADGVVGNRTLRIGQYVQAGTELMSVVPIASVYVVANFKETQLTEVRRGQLVEIEVDMFPDRTYRGRVDSFAGEWAGVSRCFHPIMRPGTSPRSSSASPSGSRSIRAREPSKT